MARVCKFQKLFEKEAQRITKLKEGGKDTDDVFNINVLFLYNCR
jgi:hypothetical protein